MTASIVVLLIGLSAACGAIVWFVGLLEQNRELRARCVRLERDVERYRRLVPSRLKTDVALVRALTAAKPEGGPLHIPPVRKVRSDSDA